MSRGLPGHSLTSADLRRLEAFLKREPITETSMTVSMIDGMLTATIIGPRLVPPSEYMPWIWDAENGKACPTFDDEQEAGRIFEIIGMGMHNRIARSLMAEPPRYRPLFADQPHGSHHEWAEGFEIGTTFDPEWNEIFEANAGKEPPEDLPWLGPLFAMDNPEAREMAGDEWPLVLGDLETMIVDLRDLFRAQTEEGDTGPIIEQPFVRPGPKVGRNDPCPCGSGRKFKKCCGESGGAVH